MGISLRFSSNDEGPSRVWMALLEQHSPSSPVFHNLRHFIDAISPTAPTTGLPLKGHPVATADANQNCVTTIRHSFLFLARSLASLTSILLSFRALFTPSIHPNLGLPLALLPSTFALYIIKTTQGRVKVLKMALHSNDRNKNKTCYRVELQIYYLNDQCFLCLLSTFLFSYQRMSCRLTEVSKGSRTSNDNCIQSLESQVNLCMYGGHRPAKSG